MVAAARAGLIRKQELPPGLLAAAGTQGLGPSFTAFPEPLLGS